MASWTMHFGRVSAIKPEDCTARVRLDDMQAVETYWLPVGQYRAGSSITAYWMPEVDELVLVALDPTGSQGCILAGVYSTSTPPPASSAGLLAIAVPLVTLAGDVEITGDVTVTGNIKAEGDVAVTGSHSINGKDTIVVGSKDSAGDTNSESGQ